MNINRLKETLSLRLSRDYQKIMLSVAVLWFSIRVIPKPSRIVYPCQRATMGMFAAKLGITISLFVASTTSLVNRKSLKILFVLALVGVLVWDPLTLAYSQYRFATSSDQRLTLADMAFDFPSQRIVRVHSNTVTNWDFNSAVSQYWEHVNQTAVDLMVEKGVMELTGAATPTQAWSTIISGYTSGQTVGIKVNGNDWWNTDDREIDSLPQITNAIIKGLKSIGVPESDIRVIENTHTLLGYRTIRPYYTNIVTALYPNVVFQYSTNTGPTYGNVAGTTVTFPYGSTRINDQIASVDHLILVPIMKAITPVWGITGSIKLMQGVIDLQSSNFHNEIARTSADNPHVLVYQNQHIIGKTRLIVGDGMFGAWTGQHFAQDYGGNDYLNTPVNDVPKPWITFNDGAPNSLFFGVDPVAIDSVMYDHILRERNAQDQVAGQTLAPFNDPQLIAGQNAGLGIREHGPPYTNIDYREVELAGPPSEVRDIAITNVAFRPKAVIQSGLVNLNVTVANHGNTDEFFNVTTYYDQTVIETRLDVFLNAGAQQLLTFTWNTGGVPVGVHTIKATATVLPGETYAQDNTYIDGNITVSLTPVHDVAIIAVSASPVTAVPGDIISVAVTAENQGTETEDFSITVYANTTAIATKSVTLASSATSTETFSWDTTGALGLYLITAEAEPVQDEVDTVDNTLQFDGAVAVFTYPVQFPVASFTLSPTNPLIGETVTLDGSSSSDPDGNIVSYQWDFGDGNTGSGPTTTHVYSTVGNYTVTLTVTDNDGLFDTDRKHILVRKNPIASFTFSPANPLVGETVTFDAVASTPEGGAIISYKWDFGDTAQTTRNDATVTHVFSAKGTYVVTLTVTDDEGLTGTMTKQIPVGESSTPSLLPLEIVLALVIVAAVAVAVAVMLLSRRRV